MKKSRIIILSIFVIAVSAFAIIDEEHRLTNAHNIPTAYTLNEGEILIGIGPLAYGITDNMQVGTNLLADILGVFNANLKYNLIDNSGFGLAGGAGWSYFKLGDDNFNSINLSANASFLLSETFKIHLGANYAIIPDFDLDSTEVTGSAAGGTSVPVNIELNLNEHSAILAGAGYDLSFEAVSFGASYLHSWEKFNLQVGAHYSSGDGWDYIMPVIGLWWRW